ncbi:MAG: 3,4-dihydroxy-2-butanone-4-phosphate synthase, partial [Chloroflexi bacterium]|nr:3,4-dihydroxy-2-butanone-4-phosphate synthase [Chloroflexota bacterium]
MAKRTKNPAFGLATVEDAIEEYRQGRFVIIIDHEDRENEGDLTLPSQFVDADAINYMAKFGRGLICISMTEDRLDKLGIPMMVGRND